ncbi:MAG: sigma-70 family RNA polymerase sigma factor [Candidatus Kapabacteria bacterium]|nr:sigma-70 family RNA polymerase sigma factor [Candidatus Kapabacteria bacterium]
MKILFLYNCNFSIQVILLGCGRQGNDSHSSTPQYSEQPHTFCGISTTGEYSDMNQTAKQERFMHLFKPVQYRLERYALSLVRDRDEAKDVVGETVLKAYEHFEQLREDQAFLSFLFTIATRVAQQRKFRRADRMSDEQIEDLFENYTSPEAATDVRILYTALDKLPAEQREALIMAEISGLSHKEIQDVQGGTISGIKVRIFRAKRRLAKLLGSTHFEQSAAGEENGIPDPGIVRGGIEAAGNL